MVQVVVEMALSPWEALAEACAELPADYLPPSAAAKLYYRVLAAFARVLSGFAA